jgi:murein DD-endopeptidase MepM/ murein hydrolase activator NlpD
VKRRRHDESRGRILFPLFIALVIGGAFGWLLRDRIPPESTLGVETTIPTPSSRSEGAPPSPAGTASRAAAVPESRTEATPVPEPPPPSLDVDPIAELRRHALRVPLDDLDVEKLKGGFFQRRDRGGRPHEAADLMAPRMTPIRAVESGRIAKLFLSKAGGLTIYQFDPSERYCYYYAHLQQYADGLADGGTVQAGDVIGYVGSTGNAAPDAPHLHFAIFKLTAARHWWEGTPIDPYLVFRK